MCHSSLHSFIKINKWKIALLISKTTILLGYQYQSLQNGSAPKQFLPMEQLLEAVSKLTQVRLRLRFQYLMDSLTVRSVCVFQVEKRSLFVSGMIIMVRKLSQNVPLMRFSFQRLLRSVCALDRSVTQAGVLTLFSVKHSLFT